MPVPSLRLTVLTGRHVLAPLPAAHTARLRSVKVTEAEKHRSVFTLIFDAGRSGREGGFDVPGASGSAVSPFTRVVMELCFGATPVVLMDGVITQVRLEPGDGPGTAALSVTGEDVSYWLDQEERTVEHPVQEDHKLVATILDRWAGCGIATDIATPADSQAPLATDWVPTQQGSDLAHLNALAAWHGFVAYMIPGPTRGVSTFYWGPPVRGGRPQPALSVDLGPETTLGGVSFRAEALAPAAVDGVVFDRRTCRPAQVHIVGSPQRRLAAAPLWDTYAADIRRRLPTDQVSDGVLAAARAQAQVDRSLDAVTAEGTVDGARYGHVLRPRRLVGVRGAGWSNDGLWYVKAVEHNLSRGSYRQQVTLTREGYGSTVQVVELAGDG